MRPARARALALAGRFAAAQALRPLAAVALAVVLGLAPATARAGDGFTGLGAELRGHAFAAPTAKAAVDLHGYLRLRGGLLDNLDLDRGLDSSGRPLFPVPLTGGQDLGFADSRLRTDLDLVAPGGTVSVHARIDVLDDVGLGTSPDAPTVRAATPAASAGERPLEALAIKRAWGEVLTPFGLLAAGRMGNDWGLGILANGGDCETCDGGDATDRVAFVTPLLGHLFALAYDFDAVGATATGKQGLTVVDLAPTADVHTVTFAFMKWKTRLARDRRRRAGRATFEYGAWLSHRWQQDDVPGSWMPTAQPVAVGPSGVMARGYQATAVDGWARLTTPRLEVQAEAALLLASVAQPSLVPGVLLHTPVTSTQVGAAMVSAWHVLPGLVIGLDAGYASGDPAPGFGAFPQPGATAPRPGALDGPQANPPSDTTVDNFRFHPDFHVDRILFRELIGAVTDALYLRPHLTWRLVDLGNGHLELGVAAIASRAVYASSTPGGAAPLGLEVDPTLRYATDDGFALTLEHAVLFPLAGLDNPAAGLKAQPAQLVRLRLFYRF